MSLSENNIQTDYRLLSKKTRNRYNRIAPVYDLMEWFIERIVFKPWRKLLWSKVGNGKTLEIGVGTGKNISYHPSNTEVTAIDLSDQMMIHAKAEADKQSKSIKFHLMDVQSLDFPDNSFDSAVATFVFCSVPQPIQGLKEIQRVVKPGGDIWLLEHVRVNKPVIGFLMDLLNPLIVRIMGANINRQTVKNVEASGLRVLEVDNFHGNLVKLIHAKPG